MNKAVRRMLIKGISGILIFCVFMYMTIFICSIPRHFTAKVEGGKIMTSEPVGNIAVGAASKMGEFLSGDMNRTRDGKPLGKLIFTYLEKSIVLLLFGVALGIVFGIIKGIFDSRRGRSKGSNLKVLMTIIPISLPDILNIAILQALAIWLIQHGIKIVKVGGAGSINHVILPIIALSILPACYVARVTAMSIEECFEKDYVKTAVGKGCSPRRILWNHVMRNAVGIIVESFSNITSLIICNMMIVEYMFAYPGLTNSLLKSIRSADQNTMIAAIITIGVIYFALDNLFKILNNSVSKTLREESV